MTEPERDERGACVECRGRGLCEYHKIETQRLWMEKQQTIARAGRSLRTQAINAIAAQNELESDEAGTAYEKAERMLNGYNPIPQHLMISGL